MFNKNRFNFTLSFKIVCMLVPLLALILICLTPIVAHAEFTLYVGYTGGPYYKKTVYSDDDMKAMSSTTLYEYSSIDRMPSIRKGFARGVILSQFFKNAGIKSSELKRFYFATQDGYVPEDGEEGYGAWYYDELCTTKLYYYPNLFNSLDDENGEWAIKEEVAYKGAKTVPTIIAYESDFHRCFEEKDWITPNLTSGYRLMFGQKVPNIGDAHSLANAVRAMTCIFKGTPKISFGAQTSFEGEIGDIITIKPVVEAADPLIEKEAAKNISWTVSDTSVVQIVTNADGTIKYDDNGNIQLKIVGKGKATLSGTYGNSTKNIYRTGLRAGVSGKGKGEGEGEGDGKSDGNDSGSGGGSGGGSGKNDGRGGAGDGEGGDGGTGDHSISKGDDLAISPDTKSGEAAEGIGDESEGSGGGGSSDEVQENVLTVKSKPTSERQAWVVNPAKDATYQQSMIDDPLLIARPAALAVILFGCFVIGCIIRVFVCERAKDPYVDKRLREEKKRR